MAAPPSKTLVGAIAGRFHPPKNANAFSNGTAQDLATGRAVSEPIPETSGSVVWANDNATLVRGGCRLRDGFGWSSHLLPPAPRGSVGAHANLDCNACTSLQPSALVPLLSQYPCNHPLENPNPETPQFYVVKDKLDRPYKVMRHK